MIDFLKYRYVGLTISAIFLVIGIFAYILKGGFKYHIDFAGGAELQISFEKKLEVGQLRKALIQKGWKDSVIQSVGATGKKFLVRVAGQEIENLEEKFKADVSRVITDNKMAVDSIDLVGAAVGKDMQKNAIIAVLLSLLLILLYVSVRSKYEYALGAVAALMHDVLAVLVFLLLFGQPISLPVLAALLAILGYSLNDTIVVFSRIRENFKKMQGAPALQVVNTSLNQILKRTLLTSFSTLLAVGSFFLLGGETLRGFSFAMLIGIFVGTYSSIYIASPVMLAVRKTVSKL